MAKLLHWFSSKSDQHLDDTQILAAIDGDVPTTLSPHAARHLDSCWQCLARQQELKDTIVKVVDYQKELVSPFLPPPPLGEERFLARLDSQVRQSRLEQRPLYLLWLRSLGFPHMNPVFASTLVVLFALGLLIVIWNRTGPATSATELLLKAEVWDRNPNTESTGVIYQRIQIRAPQRTLERTIYRDVERRRRPKTGALDRQDEQLKTKLAIAGVSWEEPLSVTAFSNWRDHQTSRRDEVVSSGESLLTLRTTVENGAVKNESLTVRKADFHPVARSIQFRDAGAVEVAELDYAVLGWSAVNDSLFEPASLPVEPPKMEMAALPTREQLDDAELQARLVLSRLNADSEQLELLRSSRGITVNGVVETAKRKEVLLAQLRSLPYVTSSIFSVEDLKKVRLQARQDSQQAMVGSIHEYSEVASPSPLETELHEQGKSPIDLSAISQRLLDAALAVQQEASAVTELSQRFPEGSHLSDQARATLDRLLERHSAKLEDGLAREEQLIRSISVPEAWLPEAKQGEQGNKPHTLTAAVALNRSLCNELITSASSPPRNARAIATDILASIDDVRSLAKDSRTQTTNAGP